MNDVKQNKTLVQPMLQVMALSEVCDCKSLTPVINIFGNRQNFRPLLYFKDYDVMLTTPLPFTYMINNNELCLEGLIMLHVLLNLHRYPFKEEKVKKMKQTGWAKAQTDNNPQAYKHSISYLAQLRKITIV